VLLTTRHDGQPLTKSSNASRRKKKTPRKIERGEKLGEVTKETTETAIGTIVVAVFRRHQKLTHTKRIASAR